MRVKESDILYDNDCDLIQQQQQQTPQPQLQLHHQQQLQNLINGNSINNHEDYLKFQKQKIEFALASVLNDMKQLDISTSNLNNNNNNNNSNGNMFKATHNVNKNILESKNSPLMINKNRCVIENNNDKIIPIYKPSKVIQIDENNSTNDEIDDEDDYYEPPDDDINEHNIKKISLIINNNDDINNIGSTSSSSSLSTSSTPLNHTHNHNNIHNGKVKMMLNNGNRTNSNNNSPSLNTKTTTDTLRSLNKLSNNNNGNNQSYQLQNTFNGNKEMLNKSIEEIKHLMQNDIVNHTSNGKTTTSTTVNQDISTTPNSKQFNNKNQNLLVYKSMQKIHDSIATPTSLTYTAPTNTCNGKNSNTINNHTFNSLRSPNLYRNSNNNNNLNNIKPNNTPTTTDNISSGSLLRNKSLNLDVICGNLNSNTLNIISSSPIASASTLNIPSITVTTMESPSLISSTVTATICFPTSTTTVSSVTVPINSTLSTQNDDTINTIQTKLSSSPEKTTQTQEISIKIGNEINNDNEKQLTLINTSSDDNQSINSSTNSFNQQVAKEIILSPSTPVLTKLNIQSQQAKESNTNMNTLTKKQPPPIMKKPDNADEILRKLGNSISTSPEGNVTIRLSKSRATDV